MNVTRHRTTRHWLTVVALGAIALTGCTQNSADRIDPAAATKPMPSSAPAETTTEVKEPKEAMKPTEVKEPKKTEKPKDTSASTGLAPFAGTGQFVTVGKAWTTNGRTYLAVRPATKEINTRFDTWEITPGTGPFTTVPLTEDARVLLATPVRGEVAGVSRAELLPSSSAEFVTLLNQLDPSLYDGIGYDLVFDGAGRATSLKSLYRP